MQDSHTKKENVENGYEKMHSRYKSISPQRFAIVLYNLRREQRSKLAQTVSIV